MTSWKKLRIDDLGKVVTGKTPPTSKPEFYGGETQFLTPTDMDGRRTIYKTLRYLSDEGVNKVHSSLLPKGSVSVSCIGSDMGKAVVVGSKTITNQQINSIIVNDEFDNLFVYYNLSGRKDEIQFLASGAAQPIMNKTDFSNLPINVPNIKNQKAIASVLGALDDKIENNRRMNETLEEMARAIFKSWFVDFDPVHAKAAGKAPAHMDAKTAELFPNSFSDDGLPMSWEKKKFGNLISNTIGGDWGKETADDKHKDQVYIIRGTDIPSVRNNSKGNVPLRWVDPKKSTTRKLCEGDIVIEVSGGSPTQPTGRSLFITKEVLDRFDFPLIPTSFCRLMRPKDDKYTIFLYQHLSNLYQNGGTWEYQNQSTGIANFQTTYFLNNEDVIVPSDQILAAFNSLLLPILKKANNNENIVLAELRDTLLPKLMSGEIRVKDAEQEVEAAL